MEKFYQKKLQLMKQPVRKNIQALYEDRIKDKFYTLLIDGTNLLKICMADPKLNTRGEHIGGVYQFLYQIRKLLEKRDWSYIYVFFDDENSGVLRYKLYNQYKANRDKHYAPSQYAKEFNARINAMTAYFKEKNSKSKDTSNSNATSDDEKEKFIRERTILMKYFNELYIRWMMDEDVEGDDLISYYVLNKKDEECVVIVSSDMDITQLLSPTVCIYNPKLKKVISINNFKEEYGFPYQNVLISKIICGDHSDNIGNISGMSKTTMFKIMPEMKNKEVTIDDFKIRVRELIEERKKEKKKPLKVYENVLNGISNKKYDGDFYEINEKIINLKKPLLTKNAEDEISNMMYAPQDPEGRSLENLYRLVLEDDIIDLLGDTNFSSFFSPFNRLVESEKKYYKKYLENK